MSSSDPASPPLLDTPLEGLRDDRRGAERSASCAMAERVEPRFEGPLRAEIDRRLDLHRAVLEWRALEVVPLAAAAAPEPTAAFAQAPQGAGTPPARKPLP